MRPVAVRLPSQLHARLREEAERAGVGMAALVRELLQKRVNANSEGAILADPILKVAGIACDPPISLGIDDSLYHGE